MKRKISNRLGLTIKFSSIVFVILLITALIAGTIAFFAFSSEGVEDGDGPPFIPIILIMMILSVVIGTVLSFFLSKFPLKPIRKIIDAINQLAAGDFSVRLDITKPAELQELGESINRMAKELGGIELLRSDFVNSFSHEFKTPIVSLKGFAEMLKYEELTEEEKNEYLDIIISESNRLAALATNILNLSKLENQNILTEKKKFNITEQVRRSILIFETRWEKKNITFNVDMEELYYNGNDDLIGQIWLNLIENAIKFTPKGGKIDISLKQVGQNLQFIIRDNGCGIKEDALQYIFNKFYQADTSHVTEGHGLGLTFVHKIVDLHRGFISCKSKEKCGSEFTVLLPMK